MAWKFCLNSADRAGKVRTCAGFGLLLFAVPLTHANPLAALWTAPAILIASVLITWGAESAQFFVAQGFALAILAWMQTLPEFAVEAVLAWKQQTGLLLANLTGALRLLTGLAWPLVYITAAVFHRRRTGLPLKKISLDTHHSVEVIALIPPLTYALVIWWKANLHIFDAAVLIAIYIAYLAVLSQLPAKGREDINELEWVPRTIVQAPRRWRVTAIAMCFVTGGALIYFMAEPFLGSMVAVAGAIGLPTFVVIQWLAPVISEFPEIASTFYFARQEDQAPVGIMNITSSNINQWTLLVAMLPIVFSMSQGALTGFALDGEQRSELLLTIAQSVTSVTILLTMEFEAWEAVLMLLLFAAQFVLPAAIGAKAREVISAAFGLWTACELIRLAARRKMPPAFSGFRETWRSHVTD
jgi:cation:H+ antiporter